MQDSVSYISPWGTIFFVYTTTTRALVALVDRVFSVVAGAKLLTIKLVLQKWLSILLFFIFFPFFACLNCTSSVGVTARKNLSYLYKAQSCTNLILRLKGLFA